MDKTENAPAPVGADLDGRELVTQALRELLDRYPRLGEGEHIAFATLGDSGVALYPGDTAVIERERRYITGFVRQECRYTFAVLWRAIGPSEERRAYIKQWLDDLGRWLEGQPVTEDGQRLERYPAIGEGRCIRRIRRASAAALIEADAAHRTETWAATLAVAYDNEFQNRMGG